MKKFIFMITIIFLVSTNLKAVDISGEIDSSYFAAIKNYDSYRKYLKLDLIYDKAFDNTEIKAIVRAENDSIRVTTPERVYLREAYINQDIYFNKIFDSLNFKFGKILYTWGNADELKPVDILNPQDLSFLLFKPIQERKYGLFSGNLTLYLTENLFIEMVALPQFQPTDISSKIFVIKEMADIESNPLYTLNNSIEPDDNLKSASYASRIGLMLFDIDTHLIYYKGYDHLSVLETSLVNPTNGSMSLTPVYKKIEMFGFDFQRALFSGISIRGEIAYFPMGKYFSLSSEPAISTNPLSSPFMKNLMIGGNGTVQKKSIEYTAGFDANKLFIKNLYANFQINGQYIIDHSSDLADEQNSNSLLGTLEYTFLREKMKTKVKGFYNINEKAYAIGLDISYKISNNYEITSGTWFLDGKEDTEYGQFKDNDFAYIEGKVVF